MDNSKHLSRILELNLAMVLISTSGALGRFITMPPPVTIFWRALLAGVFLYLFCKVNRTSLKINWGRDGLSVIVGGILMGAHWITYFYSLQLSNVAIGMLSIFTYPVITTFLEPLLLKTKFEKTHLLLGLLVLVGIYFLVPEFDIKNNYTRAVGFGVFSAFCYALRNIIMKKQIGLYNGSSLMFYQIIIVSVLLLPIFGWFEVGAIKEQWPAVVLLALLTTAIGHTLFLMSFRHFSITTASLISSAQPVYGILIGMFFLKEYPSLMTVLGGMLILSSVVIESIRSGRRGK